MFKSKSYLKKLLLILAGSLITMSLLFSFAGCSSEEAATEDTSNTTATTENTDTADEAEKPTITFSDRQWESVWLENAIAQFIIEEGYDYPTESIQVTTAAMQISIVKGEIDLDLEAWQQNYPDWYEENINSGAIEELGFSIEGGPQVWMIPQWVHEEYGINTVEDMKDHWELFQDPADPAKGLFINSPTGWACTLINEIKFEAYGLDEYYNVMDPGSAGAETAALAGPQKKSEPVFGYYWAPTALMGMFDWYILEEPEYSDEVWDKISAAVEDESLRPIDEACAYLVEPQAMMANKDLREKAPDVVAMMENFTVGLDRCNKALAWVEENEIQNWEKAAVWFLREYGDLWIDWMPEDIYTKVKAAVDDYGPLT